MRTGEKTDIFEGSLATELNTGDPTPKVLSLFEGENITVKYDYKARANGLQHVEVKLSIRSTAGVMNLAGK
jgi:hypothetical protein